LNNLCIIQIQCNVFSGASGEVSLTAAGGLRKIGVGDTYESPSLVQFVILCAFKFNLLHTSRTHNASVKGMYP